MFSKFIRRPVFAIVISVVIVFMGILAIKTLPTSQFPEISPPMVMVSCAYPGASAKVLTESVLIPLEQAVNGVPGMKYMTSDAVSAGEANIQIVFNLGTNPDQAVVNVNTRIAQVLNRLSLERRLRGHEVVERFYEVGSPNGLLDFEIYVGSVLRGNRTS